MFALVISLVESAKKKQHGFGDAPGIGLAASDRSHSQANIWRLSSTRQSWTVTLIASLKWPPPTDPSPTSTKVHWPTLEAGAGVVNNKMVTGVSGGFLGLHYTAFSSGIVWVPGFYPPQLRLFDLGMCPLQADKDV
jgi:hypothetical protein